MSLFELLPGCLHAGPGGFVVPVAREVRSLRFTKPRRGRLDLALSIEGPTASELEASTVEATPPHRHNARPEDVLRRGYRTEKATGVFLEIRFAQPVFVREVRVHPQVGPRAQSCYDVILEASSDNGDRLRLGNTEAPLLRPRLESFRRQAEELAAWARGEVPGRPELGPVVDRYAEALRRSTEAFNAILDARSDDGYDTRQLRMRLLAALADLVDQFAGQKLQSCLALAGPIASWLVVKVRPLSPSSPDFDTEVGGLAIYFAMHVVRKLEFGGTYFRDCLEMLREPAAIAALERKVSACFARAGGDPGYLPILVRRHSFGASRLRHEATRHLDAMKHIVAALESDGYAAALCYGTLLGAVRDKNFIAYDDDVDLILHLKNSTTLAEGKVEMAEVAALLHARGIKAKVRPNGLLTKAVPPGGATVDLFAVIPTSADGLTMFMERMQLREVPRKVVLPFAPIDFLGEVFPAPADPEGFLAERYGDWRTPVRYCAGDESGTLASPELTPADAAMTA